MSSTFTNTSPIIDPHRQTHSHAGQGAQSSQSSAFAEDLLPSCQIGALWCSQAMTLGIIFQGQINKSAINQE